MQIICPDCVIGGNIHIDSGKIHFPLYQHILSHLFPPYNLKTLSALSESSILRVTNRGSSVTASLPHRQQSDRRISLVSAHLLILPPSSLLFCSATLPVSRSHVEPTASQQPLPPPAWFTAI